MKRNPATCQESEDRLHGGDSLTAAPCLSGPNLCTKTRMPRLPVSGHPGHSSIRHTSRPECGRNPVNSHLGICDAILALGPTSSSRVMLLTETHAFQTFDRSHGSSKLPTHTLLAVRMPENAAWNIGANHGFHGPFECGPYGASNASQVRNP